MAEIVQAEGKQKGGKKRAKKFPAQVDMTPMVDLMCLLITFFMLTTAFSKPKIMEIVLPEKLQKNDPNYKPPKIPESRTINIILGPEDKVYWYPGKADPANPPALRVTDYSATGVREILLDRNRALFKLIDQFQQDVLSGKIDLPRDSVPARIKQMKIEDDTGPIILIKAYKTSVYKNFVDIIDEMSIVGIARYTFVDITPLEEKMVQTAMAQSTTAPATK
jgi:biopolymer transport protein ExbD